MSIFDTFKSGMQRTKTMLVRNIQTIVTGTNEWNAETYERLEAALIGAALGVDVSTKLVAGIRDRYERGLIETTEDIIRVARHDIGETLTHPPPIIWRDDGPTVILLVGVNGSGKTTSAGKMAYAWKAEGKSVMLAACDTFRAAAVDQIKVWGERVGCDVISSTHGADAAAVAYDAATAAVARQADILLIDTAGRQHTRKGLMDELNKIFRSIGKACPGAPHEVWLVVDGSTGTNALSQAREFTRVVDLSGLCVTKLDGTSKGGAVVAINAELQLPIRFVGLGEQLGDLQPFDAEMFAAAIFE